MRKKERERLKLVAYDAYMTGQSEGEKTEQIVENLAKKYHVCERTIQNWIYAVSERRNRTIDIVEHMARGVRPVYDEKTGKTSYEAWLEF